MILGKGRRGKFGLFDQFLIQSKISVLSRLCVDVRAKLSSGIFLGYQLLITKLRK